MRAIVVIAAALLAGCATAPPAIPTDLHLVCYRGQWVAVSVAAGEAFVFGTRCDLGA